MPLPFQSTNDSSVFPHVSHIKVTWLITVLLCLIDVCILVYYAFKLNGKMASLGKVYTPPPNFFFNLIQRSKYKPWIKEESTYRI